MRYTHVFIDLDGTVVDSSHGVTSSVAYALQKSGVTPPPTRELTCFIGPPLLWSFAKFYGMNEEESKRAVEYYREFYSGGGIFDCRVYEGFEGFTAFWRPPSPTYTPTPFWKTRGLPNTSALFRVPNLTARAMPNPR